MIILRSLPSFILVLMIPLYISGGTSNTGRVVQHVSSFGDSEVLLFCILQKSIPKKLSACYSKSFVLFLDLIYFLNGVKLGRFLWTKRNQRNATQRNPTRRKRISRRKAKDRRQFLFHTVTAFVSLNASLIRQCVFLKS